MREVRGEWEKERGIGNGVRLCFLQGTHCFRYSYEKLSQCVADNCFLKDNCFTLCFAKYREKGKGIVYGTKEDV